MESAMRRCATTLPGLLLAAALCGGLAAAPLAARAEASDSAGGDEAARQFDEAMAALARGDRKGALQSFRAAHAARPAAATLWNIVVTEVEMGLAAAAHRDLDDYVVEYGTEIPESRRREVALMKGELEASLCSVRVLLSAAGAAMHVDNQPAEPGKKLWLVPGTHRIHITAAGRRPVEIVVDLAAGAHRNLSPELPEMPVDRAQQRGGLVLLGAGIGALAAGGILAGMALDVRLGLDRMCPSDRCPDAQTLVEYQRKREEGATLGSAATVPLVFGTLLGAVGVHLVVTAGRGNTAPLVQNVGLGVAPAPGGASALLTASW